MGRSKSIDSSVDEFETYLEEYISKLEEKYVSQSRQLQTITDNAASGLFMVDKKGLPIFMNPAAEKLTGYLLDEIKGRNLYNVLHRSHDGIPSFKCPIFNYLKVVKEGKDIEDMFVRKNGDFFYASFSISPLRQNEKLNGAVVEFQDITKRKSLEKQKDDFISIASHELKTPVTSMKIFGELLERRLIQSDDQKSAELVGKVTKQLNKLSILIADLLDVTKMEGGRLQFRQAYFDFNRLVDEIVEEMSRTTTHHFEKKMSKTKTIFGDRERIGQVIVNLVTNAIKYSPPSSKITLSSVIESDRIILNVIDRGIGINKEDRSKVFDRFYRSSDENNKTYPGLGLGLYISSQIIKRHKGEIWVNSYPKRGTVFSFSLPLIKHNGSL